MTSALHDPSFNAQDTFHQVYQTVLKDQPFGGQADSLLNALHQAILELHLTAKKKRECLKPFMAMLPPEYVNPDGMNALMLACQYGFEEHVQRCLPLTDPLLKDKDGNTALMHAVMSWRYGLEIQNACVNLLLPVSDLNSKNGFHENALMLAAHQDNAPLIKKLLLSGANVEDFDLEGKNPLMSAFRSGSMAVVEVLLEASDVFRKNKVGIDGIEDVIRSGSYWDGFFVDWSLPLLTHLLEAVHARIEPDQWTRYLEACVHDDEPQKKNLLLSFKSRQEQAVLQRAIEGRRPRKGLRAFQL